MQSNTEFRGKASRFSIPTHMETVLLSANFDSINLVQLDLLGTLCQWWMATKAYCRQTIY